MPCLPTHQDVANHAAILRAPPIGSPYVSPREDPTAPPRTVRTREATGEIYEPCCMIYPFCANIPICPSGRTESLMALAADPGRGSRHASTHQAPDQRESLESVNRESRSGNVLAELGILEPQEVAALLKLRQSTVLDLSRRGILPAFKVGKHWRYRRSELEAWLTARRPAA